MRIIKLVIVLTVLMIFVACGDKDASKNEAQENNNNSNNTSNNNSNSNSTELDNLTDTEMPIVKEKITLDIFTGKGRNSANTDFNDILIWNEYEDMTNIEVKWDQVERDSIDEKRNLTLAGGDMPDVFYAAKMPNLDLLKYGEQGVFIPLNDLIEDYAPNFKKMLEQYPEIEKTITFPDGNIYSLPIIYEPEFSSLLMGASPWFNKEILTKIDIEIPKNTDDLYDYLVAVRDYNESTGENFIPLGSSNMGLLFNWLQGPFGVANKGVNYIDLDNETEDLRFFPISDEYKQLIEYTNKLYGEELIDQSLYSHEHADFLTKLEGGTYGSMFYYSSSAGGEDLYESGYALEGPRGYQEFVGLAHPVSAIGQFIITDENEHPEATMRWVDYFYSDEGARLFYMGIEGETYNEIDENTFEYVDEIINDPNGLTLNEAISKHLTWVGAGSPGIIKQKYFAGTESSPQALAAAERLEPNFIPERWPGFLYTSDENKRLSALASDIEKYVDEMRDKFIVGSESLDGWDDYIKNIQNMGLEEYMEIQGQALERYLNN